MRIVDLFTCCWTDHRNGCPRDDLKGKTYEASEEGNLAFVRDWHGAQVRLGYEKPVEEEKLLKKAAAVWGWRLDDLKFFQTLSPSNGKS